VQWKKYKLLLIDILSKNYLDGNHGKLGIHLQVDALEGLDQCFNKMFFAGITTLDRSNVYFGLKKNKQK